MPTLYDRVRETTTQTGTGTLTLLGAVSTFQSFDAIGNGNTTPYAIVHRTAAEWEVGEGVYTSSGTTLSRPTISASSNAGAAVNFSAGTKDVFVSASAAYLNLDASATTRGAITTGTQTIAGDKTFESNDIGTTSTDVVSLVNSTAAAAGLQQQTPRIRLTGQGWKTTATAASQTVDWAMQVVPVQGTTEPSSYLEFSNQINGGGYRSALRLYTDSFTFGTAVFDTYGTALGIAGRRANGTPGSESATLLNDVLFSFGARGYGATAYATFTKAYLNFVCEENWTDSAQGTYFEFATTTPGTTTRAQKLRLTGAGNLLLGGATTFGTSATATLVLKNGTAPSTSPADAVQMWSADQAAGNACPHFRTENGSIVKLYKPTTYTQTYATASATHPNATAATLTDNTTGTANTTLEALTSGSVYATDVGAIRNNFADLAAMVNKLTADNLDLKKLLNQVIDDHQLLGVAG